MSHVSGVSPEGLDSAAGVNDRPQTEPVERAAALSDWVLLVAALQAAVLVATSGRYGYHGDEFYFIVAGSHPAFGYPDQPPLVPLLAWAMHDLGSGSLVVLRLPSAIAGALTTLLAALTAREIGGGRRAQVIAAACTAVSGFALAASHMTSTTTYDMLSTAAFLWLVIRALVRRCGRTLFAAGLVVGVGFEAKPQVGIVAVAVAAAIALAGPRWPLRTWWTAAGVLAAVGLATPYLIWQQRHGWPQVTVAQNIGGSAEGGRAGFLPFQLVMVSIFLVPVWIAGLLLPFRCAEMRLLRFLPLAYLGLAAAYLVGNGKAYYLASIYPTLLGLGALPAADWTLRHRRRLVLLVAAVAVSAAMNAFIALPLLPERSLQGSLTMKLNPDLGENVGWPGFIATVATAWHKIPAQERGHTAIFAATYHEAGAIDVLAQKRLPYAYSAHNGFSEWGKPPTTATHALILGYQNAADAAPYFDNCHTLATINNEVGLNNNEQGLPVQLCQPAASWPTLWPHLTHYD
jgi:dolichyl-phosphate-mannose-protein mannosyltransferase